MNRLAKEGRFDQLVIESTGISEPLPVAETFTFADESGQSLSDVARLDTMVTVVDGFNFLRDYSSRDSLQMRGESLGDEDKRRVVDLLIEQIEFCDVIVLNKTDLIDASDRERLSAILTRLNPRATIVESSFGRVPLDSVLDTKRFDFEDASKAPGWLAELRGEHKPETDEYGIRSFVWRARRPLHPQRFWDLVNGEWPGVIRSKGFFWLASRPTLAGTWSQAGAVCRHGMAGMWWAAVPNTQWPDDAEAVALIKRNWDDRVGDARQELVLIGVDMDEPVLRQRLDACLLDDAEISEGPHTWTQFVDPFPEWGARAPQETEAV